MNLTNIFLWLNIEILNSSENEANKNATIFAERAYFLFQLPENNYIFYDEI